MNKWKKHKNHKRHQMQQILKQNMFKKHKNWYLSAIYFNEYHPIYFLWAIFTLLWFTMAYCMVVSICTCPNSLWTCSIGIPLSIALVAIVLLNLWGCTFLISDSRPSLRILFSTPVIPILLWGFLIDTKRAGLLSSLDSRYFCRWIFVFASK